MGLTGLVVVLASSYNYATQLKGNKKGDKCVPLVACVVSLIAYIATIPNAIDVGDSTITAFQINFFNYEGMFTGMVIGLASAYLYYHLVNSKYTIKLPGQVPPMVLSSFLSIIPFFVIMVVFSGIKEIVNFMRICFITGINYSIYYFTIKWYWYRITSSYFSYYYYAIIMVLWCSWILNYVGINFSFMDANFL